MRPTTSTFWVALDVSGVSIAVRNAPTQQLSDVQWYRVQAANAAAARTEARRAMRAVGGAAVLKP
jgi:hypothetical protein